MSLLAQSSVIIVLLAVVVSADVKPCCGPTKWTSGVIQTVGMCANYCWCVFFFLFVFFLFFLFFFFFCFFFFFSPFSSVQLFQFSFVESRRNL